MSWLLPVGGADHTLHIERDNMFHPSVEYLLNQSIQRLFGFSKTHISIRHPHTHTYSTVPSLYFIHNHPFFYVCIYTICLLNDDNTNTTQTFKNSTNNRIYSNSFLSIDSTHKTHKHTQTHKHTHKTHSALLEECIS